MGEMGGMPLWGQSGLVHPAQASDGKGPTMAYLAFRAPGPAPTPSCSLLPLTCTASCLWAPASSAVWQGPHRSYPIASGQSMHLEEEHGGMCGVVVEKAATHGEACAPCMPTSGNSVPVPPHSAQGPSSLPLLHAIAKHTRQEYPGSLPPVPPAHDGELPTAVTAHKVPAVHLRYAGQHAVAARK